MGTQQPRMPTMSHMTQEFSDRALVAHGVPFPEMWYPLMGEMVRINGDMLLECHKNAEKIPSISKILF